MNKGKILFVGGGHSNTIAIRTLLQTNKNIENSYDMTLISEYDYSAYSGMIPGLICGYYEESDVLIDLHKFAKVHNIKFIKSKIEKIQADENHIISKDNIIFNYDILCINVGSLTYEGDKIKGVKEHATQTRPITKLIKKIKEKEKSFEKKEEIRIVVIGGGVAGIEIAFSISYRYRNILKLKTKIYILNNNKTILPGFNECVIKKIIELLSYNGIEIINESKVIEIEKKGLIYEKKNEIFYLKSDFSILATGASPQKLNYCLPIDKNGFILVNKYMQTIKYNNIFGSGDCIQIDNYKNKNPIFPPKSGVYAVKEGYIMGNNIVKYINKENLSEYEPQKEFLILITLGDEFGFGTKFGIYFYGKWVWEMKKFIDTNFVEMFYKELKYNFQLDEILNNINFEFDILKCYEKLFNSLYENDFIIQLKILHRLTEDNKLLEELKELFYKNQI